MVSLEGLGGVEWWGGVVESRGSGDKLEVCSCD